MVKLMRYCSVYQSGLLFTNHWARTAENVNNNMHRDVQILIILTNIMCRPTLNRLRPMYCKSRLYIVT